ncbi:hypothetical protein IMSHALPRED_009204 [Imshaugia aleurites]|uniref:Uncharacterized protein n=1 Tax=Imshaugia aleurites TaxID=172621 RepID=A0A8H3EX66_9LECA|nr:hypothetical protein IMSHALPRED_009204 [Imshaugia aleurites]
MVVFHETPVELGKLLVSKRNGLAQVPEFLSSIGSSLDLERNCPSKAPATERPQEAQAELREEYEHPRAHMVQA